MKTTARIASMLVIGSALVGCGDDTQVPPAPPPNPSAAAAKAPANKGKPAASAAPTVSPTANMPALPTREFQEADFAETDKSRDPFRSYEGLFLRQDKTRVVLQREVLIDRFALDELKLVGIVSRGGASALLTDPTGLGWVAKVGDFVGKAEMVHSGGPTGTDVAINWRVDRIRESDVVFIREDTAHPEIPPTTRVIALRPGDTGGLQPARVR